MEIKHNTKFQKLIGALCCVICALMFLGFVMAMGDNDKAAESSLSAAIVERYDTYANNANAAILEGVVPIKKHYKISRDQLVAPKPDSSLFGETTDPAVMQKVIDSAEELLEGQSLVWNEERKLFPNTPIRYYLDETILTITWKEAHSGTCYTYSEVKVADPTQLRRYVADNVIGADVQYLPSEMAASVNAVVATSADFYRFRGLGVCVYDSVVYRHDGQYVDTCGFDENGNLVFVRKGEITDDESAQKFVRDNNILFSISFGPIIIDDGVNVTPSSYAIGEIRERYARAAIAQKDDLHYLVVMANEEGGYQNSATMAEFGAVIEKTGVKKAYALDGGQSATLVMNNKVINSVVFGYQRAQSDIIYFATAKND